MSLLIKDEVFSCVCVCEFGQNPWCQFSLPADATKSVPVSAVRTEEMELDQVIELPLDHLDVFNCAFMTRLLLTFNETWKNNHFTS